MILMHWLEAVVEFEPLSQTKRGVKSESNGRPALVDVARTGTQKCGARKISSPNEESGSDTVAQWHDQDGASRRAKTATDALRALDDGKSHRAAGDGR